MPPFDTGIRQHFEDESKQQGRDQKTEERIEAIHNDHLYIGKSLRKAFDKKIHQAIDHQRYEQQEAQRKDDRERQQTVDDQLHPSHTLLWFRLQSPHKIDRILYLTKYTGS